MHPIDLTAAVNAAARTAYEQDRAATKSEARKRLPGWDNLTHAQRWVYLERLLPIVTAAHRDIAQQVLRAAATKIDADGQDVNWEEDNYGAGRRHAADELEALARELDPENNPAEAAPHEG